MAEPKDSVARLVGSLVGGPSLATTWYFLIGLLLRVEFLKDYSHSIKIAQYGGAIFMLGIGLLGTAGWLLQLRAATRARKAREKVDEEFDKIRGRTPGRNVAEISTQDVAASLRGTKVDDDQLVRLVEQRKQQLLIDDEYFRDELSSLIVDYLQPVPRNAKRFLNRFRVNLLIANSRGLLTSDPKVTAQQIGKWLVLTERWPQLGRSLSAAPEKMKILEEQSVVPGLPQSLTPQQDPFMESIKTLAPFYVGDEDLRKFINSVPSLAMVVLRLAHYGTP